ncbi:MAG: ATP-binding cassette domain-containing protein [Coriobacteriaceae bacterium]|jgi:ABC-2 type transport system ATP-binding protein|nr:ATP-binding cassette domain-containing protein [Coriobacteriaceae bacterium]
MTVEVRGLTKKIHGTTVLADIDMTAQPGTIVGIRGINGSGKTMLLRSIAGFIKPTTGTVVIDGKELWRDLDFPESIGILIENPAFLGAYSAFDNLRLLASIKGAIDQDALKDCTASVGLDPASRKKYRKFSLGMKQRLGIAAAIMEQPDIILLDEPNNALDLDGIALLKDLLLKEKERGASILLACHDNEFLQEVADEVFFLDAGRIVGHTEKMTSDGLS